MPYYLGIEIGGTKLQLILTDHLLTEVKKFRFEVEQSQGADGIRSSIQEALVSVSSYKLQGIGVGFGGPIDKKTGKIFRSYHIEGWDNFSITSWLRGLCGCEVLVDNDANVAALGEALHGAGKNFQSVYYVTLGSGVGSGLVINQNIYHGAEPGETEFGHVRLNKAGLTVQDSCSGWAVNEKIRKATVSHPNSILGSLAAPLKKDHAKILLQAMSKGDEVALNIFQDTMDDLGFALSHAVHLFHPDTIILGGGLSLMGEPLRMEVERRLKEYIMDAFQPGPFIRLSELTENAVPIGAIAMIMNK